MAMLKHTIISFAIGICSLLMPMTAQSATDLKFRESHFAYSQEALANAQKEVKIIDINVSMNKTSAKVLFLKDPNDKSSFPADFKISGEKFSGRIKSFGSSTRALKKKSIILKIKGGKWQGHKRLSLRSMASDGSLMREWMAWELMRDMGMMVPDTFYVRLNINGEFIGYYLYIEWLGKHFLEKNGYNASSELYQPDDTVYCGDFRHGSKMKRCWMKLAPQGGDYSSMEALASKIKSTPPKEFDQFVTDNFEDDSLTNWLTVNTLTSQGDTYNKNYFLIKSGQTKKWKVIPWDYDLTFGQSFDMFVKFPETIFNERFQYYYTPDQGVFNPLKAKTLLNEKLKAKFYTQLEHLIGKGKNGPEKTYGWFSPTVMNARIDNLAKVLEGNQMKQKYGARSPESFVEQYDAVGHYSIVRPFFLEANLFSTFVWDYKHTDQMKEYVAWTDGQDVFPAYHPKANLDDTAQLAKPIKEHEPVGEPKKALERRVFMEKLLEKPFTGRAASADFGASLIVFDPGWGYFLARLDFREPFQITDFQSEAEAFRAPMYSMEGANLDQCIQRSWVLFTRIPSLSMKTNVTFEYFDEHTQRSELAGIKNEHATNLWVNAGEKWQPLITEVNAKANTLTVRDFQLNAGRVYRFIACPSDKPKSWSKPIRR